ncbi:uncharacterized protein LOC122071720 isoform X4 [Macadamia integrifolia]|uniref:uncharacterized protein LOC122071720 isoform X4 n=1 Tax=Macadamia integrifolia TaxID=60698 RepID=UPI001C4FC16E|nr:uncharacterized protein LOC122071720 isoform X4 [Macadamia integrifolia]
MLLRWCCFDLLERGDVVRESSSFNREGLLLGDGNPAKKSSQRRSREISEGWTATEDRADKRKEDEIQGAGGVEGSVDLRENFEPVKEKSATGIAGKESKRNWGLPTEIAGLGLFVFFFLFQLLGWVGRKVMVGV